MNTRKGQILDSVCLSTFLIDEESHVGWKIKIKAARPFANHSI